jgi:hypothetical protein
MTAPPSPRSERSATASELSFLGGIADAVPSPRRGRFDTAETVDAVRLVGGKFGISDRPTRILSCGYKVILSIVSKFLHNGRG